MKSEKQYFNEAISLETYMTKMATHMDNSLLIYEQFECPEDDEFIAILKTVRPNILVITEDWCGDAMMNNPILRKISEAANLDVRVVYRDENPELIDRHLTKGGRSIPIYLMLNTEGEVIAKWGPRATSIQDYVLDLRKSLPEANAPEHKDKQQELINKITTEYISKPEYWLTVYEDIRRTFFPAIQKIV